MAGKYDHIDFKPPKSVADAAARGLELRKKNKGKGGLSSSQAKKEGVGSGVQRAVNLKNRNTMSPSTVRRMKAFFSRHEKNKKADKGKSLSEDKGYIAWLLWGGNPGQSWANKVVRQMEAADKKKSRAAMYARSINKLAELKDHCADDSEMSFMEHSDEHDYMAIQNMYKICDQASYLKEFMEELEINDYKYPDWLESKISGIADDMEEVFGYMRYHLDEHMDTHEDDKHHDELEDKGHLQDFLSMLKKHEAKQYKELFKSAEGLDEASKQEIKEKIDELISLGREFILVDISGEDVSAEDKITNRHKLKTLIRTLEEEAGVKAYLMGNDIFRNVVDSSKLSDKQINFAISKITKYVLPKITQSTSVKTSKKDLELIHDLVEFGATILEDKVFVPSERIAANKKNIQEFIALNNEKGLLGAITTFLLKNEQFKDNLLSSALDENSISLIFSKLADGFRRGAKDFFGSLENTVHLTDKIESIPASSTPRAKAD